VRQYVKTASTWQSREKEAETKILCSGRSMTYPSRSSRTDIPRFKNDNILNPASNEFFRCKGPGDA
jgi:hypothetical protein